jgi:type IV secretory pathway TrbD component
MKKDKGLHFIAGILVGIIAGFVSYWIAKSNGFSLTFLGVNKLSLMVSAAFWGLLAGLAKEGYDYVQWKKGKKSQTSVDRNDVKWTLYGAILSGLLIWFLAITVLNDYYKEQKVVSETEYLQKHHDKFMEIATQDSIKRAETQNRADSLLLRLKELEK